MRISVAQLRQHVALELAQIACGALGETRAERSRDARARVSAVGRFALPRANTNCFRRRSTRASAALLGASPRAHCAVTINNTIPSQRRNSAAKARRATWLMGCGGIELQEELGAWVGDSLLGPGSRFRLCRLGFGGTSRSAGMTDACEYCQTLTFQIGLLRVSLSALGGGK